MIAYCDSSVILGHILELHPGLGQALAAATAATSELALVEGCRVLERYRLVGELDDDQLGGAQERLRSIIDNMVQIPLDSLVKRRAAAKKGKK